MENNLLNSPSNFNGLQAKDNHFYCQTTTVFNALFKQPKTMLMVSVETGILRVNIYRYIAEWQKENRICIVKKGFCPITKHRAGFYTTNPDLFPIVEPLKSKGNE